MEITNVKVFELSNYIQTNFGIPLSELQTSIFSPKARTS